MRMWARCFNLIKSPCACHPIEFLSLSLSTGHIVVYLGKGGGLFSGCCRIQDGVFFILRVISSLDGGRGVGGRGCVPCLCLPFFQLSSIFPSILWMVKGTGTFQINWEASCISQFWKIFVKFDSARTTNNKVRKDGQYWSYFVVLLLLSIHSLLGSPSWRSPELITLERGLNMWTDISVL